MIAQTNDETRNLLENAVYQQLFDTSDKTRICGKNPDQTMQLTGVDKLLEAFITDIANTLNVIKEGNIGKFLTNFESKFGIALSETKERIESNFEGMGGIDAMAGQETIVVYMVLTKFLEALREFGYNQWGSNRINEAFKEQLGKKFDEEANQRLQKLAALSEENISILYNLSFIALLSTVYGDKRVITTLKRLVTTRVNKIVAKIAA